jgi:hypothetical protein
VYFHGFVGQTQGRKRLCSVRRCPARTSSVLSSLRSSYDAGFTDGGAQDRDRRLRRAGGITEVGALQDPERTRAMLGRFYEAMSAEVEAPGGTSCARRVQIRSPADYWVLLTAANRNESAVAAWSRFIGPLVVSPRLAPDS